MSSTNDVEAADADLLKKMENMKMKGSGDGEESPNEPKGELKGKAGGRRYRKRDTRSDAERMREWEENQEKKNQNVIETGLKGTVKWYSVRGHYGFIARDDGKGDIFVHQSAIWKSPTEKFYLRSLADDQPVEFNIVKGEKGLEATHVTGPNATEVKEAPRQMYRRGFRPYRNRYRRNKTNGENGESRRSVSKSEGNGDGTADEDKSGKPRRRTRKFFRRRPRGGAEENAGDQEGKAGPRRRRRGKSESANSAKAAEDRPADVGQQKETGEDSTLVDTKA